MVARPACLQRRTILAIDRPMLSINTVHPTPFIGEIAKLLAPSVSSLLAFDDPRLVWCDSVPPPKRMATSGSQLSIIPAVTGVGNSQADAITQLNDALDSVSGFPYSPTLVLQESSDT